MKKRILALLLAFVMVLGTVSTALAATTMYVKNKTTLNVRSSMTTKEKNVITQLKGGTKVSVLKDYGDWAQINWGSAKSNKGYVMKKYLTTGSSSGSTPLTGSYRYVRTVSGHGVNMRQGPSTSYAVMRVVKDGQKVLILGKKGNWSLVSYKGKTGYIYTKYLSTK